MVYCSFRQFDNFDNSSRRRFLIVQKNNLGAFSWNVYTFSVFTERTKYFGLKIAVFFLYDQRLLARSRRQFTTLQMKGRWESNINVWFPFMYYQKGNCYLQNRTIMFCLPDHTLIYLWEIFIFSGLVCLFCCKEICGPILGIYKLITDTLMWKLGLRPRNSQKRNT